jgi:hypothetical protein
LRASAVRTDDLTRLRRVEKFRRGELVLGLGIAQVAPLDKSVPPKYYSRTEHVMSYFTEDKRCHGQIARNQEVSETV